MVSPCAASPASTKDADARKSDAITGAPRSFRHAIHHCGGAVDVDLCAHANQLDHACFRAGPIGFGRDKVGSKNADDMHDRHREPADGEGDQSATDEDRDQKGPKADLPS